MKEQDNQSKQSDVVQVTIYGGGSFFMIIFGIFFLFLNYEDPNLSLIDKDKYKYLELCLRLFRMTTVFIYIIFATGYVVQTFKEYKINYLMIFGLDPLMKMTHI